MSHALHVRGVGWRAGATPIVTDVSVEVRSGELVAVLGRNGAGKSTLMDLIAGLRRPSSGDVQFDGASVGAWSARDRARRIGHLPQLTRDTLPCSAGQLVAMGRYPHSDRWFESADDRQAVDQAMTRCQCLPFRHRRMATLSGGERQRVLLAACLAQAADVLLLDEPSTFLDVEQQLQCFTLLREEAAAGRICLAVTHDLNLALTFCTRLLVLAGGRVAADLTVADALRDTRWLSLFSPRLTVNATDDGRRWVSYQ